MSKQAVPCAGGSRARPRVSLIAVIVAASFAVLALSIGSAYAQSDSTSGSSDAASDSAALPDPSTTADWWTWQNDPDAGHQFQAMVEYSSFWQERAQDLGGDDPEVNLPTIFDGSALDAELAAVRQLEANKQWEKVVVENHPNLTYATDDTFVIHDTYLSRTYLVDANTHQPLGDGPNVQPTSFPMAFRMQKFPDNNPAGFLWKVVDSVKFSDAGGG